MAKSIVRVNSRWRYPPRFSRRSAVQAVCRNLPTDRKSTRHSSHLVISYAVFCLKKNRRREQRGAVVLQPRQPEQVALLAGVLARTLAPVRLVANQVAQLVDDGDGAREVGVRCLQP